MRAALQAVIVADREAECCNLLYRVPGLVPPTFDFPVIHLILNPQALTTLDLPKGTERVKYEGIMLPS